MSFVSLDRRLLRVPCLRLAADPSPLKHPGSAIKTRANCEPGIDIRADGGYIVADPSNHISGGTYRWAESRVPEDVAPRANASSGPSPSPRPSVRIRRGRRSQSRMSANARSFSTLYVTRERRCSRRPRCRSGTGARTFKRAESAVLTVLGTIGPSAKKCGRQESNLQSLSATGT